MHIANEVITLFEAAGLQTLLLHAKRSARKATLIERGYLDITNNKAAGINLFIRPRTIFLATVEKRLSYFDGWLAGNRLLSIKPLPHFMLLDLRRMSNGANWPDSMNGQRPEIHWNLGTKGLTDQQRANLLLAQLTCIVCNL